MSMWLWCAESYTYCLYFLPLKRMESEFIPLNETSHKNRILYLCGGYIQSLQRLHF